MAAVRRMLGVVVLILGVLLIALPFTGVLTGSTVAPSASQGLANAFTPSIYGSGTVKFSWSGAGPNTTVTLFSCPGDPSCGLTKAFTSLSKVASGNGESGSFSASVTGGTTYLVTQNGTTGNLSVVYAVSGFSLDSILGIVIVVVGIVLVALPGPRRTAAEEAAARAAESQDDEPGPDEVTLEAPASKGAPVMGPAPTAVSSAAMVEAEPEPETEPDADTGAVASTSVPAGGSGKKAIKCSNCGTMNEPWITNCRWCKRTLTTTG